MTIEEALKEEISSLPVTAIRIQKVLLDAKLDGSAAYDSELHEKQIDLIYAKLLLTVIQVVEKKEDDVSIKYSTNLIGIYSAIMRKWGLFDPFAPAKPTVRQILFH